MTKGEKWRRFFVEQGWLKDDVIRGGENDALEIVLRCGGGSDRGACRTIDSALVMPEADMLCFEDGPCTVFFHWDDIILVRRQEAKKRKWL